MIEFKDLSLPPVTEAEMEYIRCTVKTPKKHGAIIKSEKYFTDSPTVFFRDGVFYMYFVAIEKDCRVSGYETHLARSNDLLHWDYVGPIFKRNALDQWDSRQCAGYAAFPDIRFGGTNELQKVNGSYYISYLAGNSDGYEPDPLYMGLAKTANPTDPDSFLRLDAPILRPDDRDSRPFETKTLYKSFLFEDAASLTGYPYVNAYNAKAQDGRERIYLAVSEDGEHWERYGREPVVDLCSDDPDERISGDPQIVKLGDIYVMFFFRFHRGKPAFNTFAASRDLRHFTVWQGKPLVESEFDYEDCHAHKTWFLHHGGINYHFYCAVNSKNERFIALATSE